MSRSIRFKKAGGPEVTHLANQNCLEERLFYSPLLGEPKMGRKKL
jgi:hypothetical protein